MASNSRTWTDERVERTKVLHLDGLTASQVARKISAEFGVHITRNAVIGIIHRRGWGRGYSDIMRAKAANKTRVKRADSEAVRANREKLKMRNHNNPKPIVPGWRSEPWKSDEPEIVIPVGERKTIETLEANHCRWPIGEPGQEGFHFCGRDRVPGVSYCLAHARRAFQPVPVRRPDYSELPVVALVEVKTKVDA